VKIEVLFFAQLREAVGGGRRSLEVPGEATVNDAVEVIRAWPEWESVAELPLTFAVNERVVGGGHRLQHGDTLALLTPISGG
jgi:molybdopterin converting factor small subunit